ncbi:ketoacyl-ACP synthase III [Paenibacillus barcinonensis]|uniref:3-oxoacyl-[acyl-carrier-protein] synthase-3 n=1 Tax=Paenibacillus barcinonensis TaxID=198119 RepID=A0A2V4VYF9_PAEBA|nr:3-oxoacyl-[acyl-carrier-protein] synthase III C-terminal domain-containing protein [Paenibacillus barcinonensis]PYE52564.1 3-oxoacyl-[acyl-carrier-protein] synthase-3 [Paenibacillus barcinonensis]QKS59286.1 ketoacyl-ACP synthase III [Paenibacillus barcinonensis]
MAGIRIVDIDIYHPETKVHNDFYIEHFDARGVDVRGLLKALGRDSRYKIDHDDENSLTMALEATQLLLAKTGFTGQDIDLIAYASQTPEYIFPTNSLMIHHLISGASHTICIDSNANCAGMTAAFEQVSRQMLGNPRIKRALIIGSDYIAPHASPDDPVYFANFGDAAAAVIVERDEHAVGFIDSIYQTDTCVYQNSLFPAEGLAKLGSKGVDAGAFHVKFTPFDDSICVDAASESIRTLLQRNEIRPDEIKAACFSQLSIANIRAVSDNIGIADDIAVYVGDEFGYTSTSSPFIALHRAITSGKVQRGDKVLFWTVGAGWQNVAMVVEF